MRVLALTLGCALIAGAANTPAQQPTFNKDVLPILQKNCQMCHRPGEVAPMSFMDYKDTRPWAKAIKSAVLTSKMPPWYADAKYGHFRNERKLSETERQTLANWADAGAPEGNAKDRPADIAFVDGWSIGKPDLVLEMPQPFEVPASGTIEYNYVIIPTHFTKDTWVTAAEVRPGNRQVVHHVIAFVRPPGSTWMKDAKPGVPFVPVTHERDGNGAAVRRAPNPEAQRPAADPQRAGGGDRGSIVSNENLTGYAPGLQPQDFTLGGAAKLIPAGSDIVFQLHYTANGKPATDQTKIGLIFAKETPKYRFVTMNAATQQFEIPPGDPAYEVHSQITFNEPVKLVWLMPHMHLRGKDFTFRAVYPTGETETLLNVPKFDFNWQLGYDEQTPLDIPKGTRLECTAHFDNSPNNPANPNPKVSVRWGDQSWEEMMIGWFAVIVPSDANPRTIVSRGGRSGD